MVKFHGSPHISSVNLMACMGSLCTTAKLRPEFMERVVGALENLNSNLPPTLSHSQVSSVRKHLKMQLLNILKHPSCGDLRNSVTSLLLELGYTNEQLARLAPKSAEEKKKQTKRALETCVLSNTNTSKRAKLVQGLESQIEDVEKMKQEANEVNSSFIVDHLNINCVIQIVLATMKNVPNVLPSQFTYDYIQATENVTDPIKNISKILAEQFTEAEVGPGSKLLIKDNNQKSTVRPNTPDFSEPSENSNTKILLDKLNREIKRSAGSNERTSKPVKIKTLKLSEVTKPLSTKLREQLLIDAVHRVLKAEKYSFRSGQSHVPHKIITTLASTFSASVREAILQFLLGDMRSHMDLALAWLYEEYSIMQGFCRTPALLRKEEKPDQNYNTLLCALINSLQNGTEIIRDRDGLLARLYLEAPLVTDEALEMLKQQCARAERCVSALNLVHDLIIRRPPRGSTFLSALLSLTIHTDQTVRECAVSRAVSIYDRNEWRETIEEHALRHLETLRLPEPPIDDSDNGSGAWTDDLSKTRLCLYMALLPHNEAMIHELSRIYVQTGADVKRTILRLLEIPVRGMGMDSPELLLLVEKCPKGAETLVTRIIHILSDRGPPSTQLVNHVRELYHSRVSDVRFLIPVLNGLSKKEITNALPKLIKLNPVVVKEVFNRLLGLHSGESPISPSELLIALHMIDPAKAEIKAIMKATSLCFAEKQVFTQEVLAVVMQQLMDINPLPTLLMRTVIQSLSLYPRLTGFVMNILQRLIVKQVWRQKVVWEGFIKCCQRTKPQSYHVMLQLPPPQLSEALTVCPDMLKPLQEHVQSLTEAQRAHIPSSVLDALSGAGGTTSPAVFSTTPTPGTEPSTPTDITMTDMPGPQPLHIEHSNIEPLPPGMD